MDMIQIGQLLSKFASGVILLDRQATILWVNDYIEKRLNGTEWVNKNFHQVLEDGMETSPAPGKVYRTASGDSYSLEDHPIEDVNGSYNLVLMTSLQDCKNKDIKLYCLEKIMESISDGIIMSDYRGKVVLYNKAQEKLEAMKARDIMGKYLWDVYHYDSEDQSEHREVYKSGQAKVNLYKAHAYKDGIPKYISYSTYPIIKDGEKIGVYSISRNENRLQSQLAETIEQKRLFAREEPDYIKTEETANGTVYTFSDIVGNSEATLSLIREAQTMAMLENNVLIVGETGTGKEVFAQSMHNFSRKKTEPFVAVNCAAIPENLLESILFGAVKGAYTGAADHVGLFEEAGAGTLFLDELNSMPVSMQTKLLRVLQEKKVRRVGGVKTLPVRCRVICAMNEEPRKLIKSGGLRQDLFYRIAGLCLFIAPLRERKRDILDLAAFFIRKYNKLLGKTIQVLSPELQEVMLMYDWPGNTRELEHVIENLMIRAEENRRGLGLGDLPEYLKEMLLGSRAANFSRTSTESLSQILREIERSVVLESLDRNSWNISETARDLGIIRQSLIYRMKKLSIRKGE